MARDLCILRERTGLAVLSIDREADAWVKRPLSPTSAATLGGAPKLLAAWGALEQAPGASAATLADLLHVLIETLPGDDRPGRLVARPRLDPEPLKPKRSAAHPRGFRGTIHQPPKSKRPVAVDLREWIAPRMGVGELLPELRPFLPEALARLRDRGFSPDGLRSVSESLSRSRPGHPFWAYRFGRIEPVAGEVDGFLRLGAALRSGRPESFRRFLALRGQLESGAAASERAAIARLLLNWGDVLAMPWLEIAAGLSPELRPELVSALVEVRPRVLSPGRFDLSAEPLLLKPCRDRRAGPRIRQYTHGLAAGLTSQYLLQGFRLLDAFGLDEALPVPERSGPVPAELLLEIFARVEADTSARYFLGTLWRLCGELPGFDDALGRLPWMRTTPKAAFLLVDLLCALTDDAASIAERKRQWRVGRKIVAALVDLLKDVPLPFQAGAVHIAKALFVYTTPMWSASDEDVARACQFIRRVCRAPLAEPSRISYVLERLALHRSADVRERFLAAPDASFRTMEKAASRGDLAGLMGDGMARLVPEMPLLAVEGFERCPEVLGRAARFLGALRPNLVPAVFSELRAHPLMAQDLQGLEPQALLELLRQHCGPDLPSPFPRAARMTLEAGGSLSDAQRARVRRTVEAQLPQLRLQVVCRLALEKLAGKMKVDLTDEGVRHALQMVSTLDENRRPLRRLLTRYFAGDRDSILRHPESVQWFGRHPKVDRDVWLRGIHQAFELPSGGVTLAIEQEPLEALRLGTYVGSCLGLNGLCAYSAAAAVLDVNKRVLYARDRRGAVVARQLLAISRDDRLVPFSVYPLGTPDALQAAFLEYDLAFARALGLPLSEEGAEPEVEAIVSNGFWDDGVWDVVFDRYRPRNVTQEPASEAR